VSILLVFIIYSSEFYVPPPDRDTCVTASTFCCVRHCAAVGISVASIVY